jgi:hypothetical protein
MSDVNKLQEGPPIPEIRRVDKPSVRERMAKFKDYVEFFGINALISILISGGVSGFALVYFTTRMEASKEHVIEVMKQKEQFDSSQNKLFVELVQYTNHLFSNVETNKEDLQGAIIIAQLQINRLRNELPPTDYDILNKYSAELENLMKQLRATKAPSDLRPILVSAQKVLELHDLVAERVKGNLKISVF